LFVQYGQPDLWCFTRIEYRIGYRSSISRIVYKFTINFIKSIERMTSSIYHIYQCRIRIIYHIFNIDQSILINSYYLNNKILTLNIIIIISGFASQNLSYKFWVSITFNIFIIMNRILNILKDQNNWLHVLMNIYRI